MGKRKKTIASALAPKSPPPKNTKKRVRAVAAKKSRSRTTTATPTATKVISLRRDVYGSCARASAVADFIELASLSGIPISERELSDHLRDSGIVIPAVKFERMSEDGLTATGEEDGGLPLSEDDDASSEDDEGDNVDESRYADSARQVFLLLAERERAVRGRYPFRLDGSRLRAQETAACEPYLALLALTVAHAHQLNTTADPKRVFETVVQRVLGARGWKTSNLAGLSKAQGGARFAAIVKAACLACEIHRDASRQVPMIRRAANEEGVDTMAHHSWSDDRPGRWTLVGQATCGSSDTWDRKLAEPKPSLWSMLFGEHVPPQAFLAVPHHVEPEHLAKLVQDSQKVVLDRLRLARFDPGVSVEEREILKAVRATAVEYR